MKSLSVAVIGHLDHGKSTLLGRLLFDSGQVKTDKIKPEMDYASLLDSFEEERVNQMTIDVFYVRYQTPRYQYTFIDTPGHKEFIKNMLSGASHAEAAVLLVSAAPGEGIQEQTKIHLKLAKLLGINQLAVVVNKMDLVNYDRQIFEKIKDAVILLLQKIGFETTVLPFIPVSAAKGVNVYQQAKETSWYQGKSFIEEIDHCFQPSPGFASLPLRFVVQDVYSFSGEKVVVGKVETGILKKGNRLVFMPSEVKTEMREVRVAEKKKEEVSAGEVVGLVLENKGKEMVRGQVAGLKTYPPFVCQEFMAQIYLIGEPKIKTKDRFLFRCGLAEEKCQIKKVLENQNGFAKVKIVTEKPVVIEKYREFPPLGRFVLLSNNQPAALGMRIA